MGLVSQIIKAVNLSMLIFLIASHYNPLSDRYNSKADNFCIKTRLYNMTLSSYENCGWNSNNINKTLSNSYTVESQDSHEK